MKICNFFFTMVTYLNENPWNVQCHRMGDTSLCWLVYAFNYRCWYNKLASLSDIWNFKNGYRLYKRCRNFASQMDTLPNLPFFDNIPVYKLFGQTTFAPWMSLKNQVSRNLNICHDNESLSIDFLNKIFAVSWMDKTLTINWPCSKRKKITSICSNVKTIGETFMLVKMNVDVLAFLWVHTLNRFESLMMCSISLQEEKIKVWTLLLTINSQHCITSWIERKRWRSKHKN